jgi:dopamine D2-like receptor
MSSSEVFETLFTSRENALNDSYDPGEAAMNFSDYDLRPTFFQTHPLVSNGSGSWLDTETGFYNESEASKSLTNLTAALAVYDDVVNSSGSSIDYSPMYSGTFSNGTVSDDAGLLPPSIPTNVIKPAYIFLLFLLFSVFTVFGNVLVILAVCRERALQTVTNYFVVSLAVADVLVATVPMPFGVYVLVSTMDIQP